MKLLLCNGPFKKIYIEDACDLKGSLTHSNDERHVRNNREIFDISETVMTKYLFVKSNLI